MGMPHIGLIGKAQSGKDSFAAVLTGGFGYQRVAFADALREMIWAMNPYIDGGLRYRDFLVQYGYERAKEHTEVRRLLQQLGTEGGRMVLGEDVWLEAAWRRAGMPLRFLADDVIFREPEKPFAPVPTVFPDVRFQNEADSIRMMGGIIIRVTRPDTLPVRPHVSEDDGSIDADYQFNNHRNLESWRGLAHSFAAGLKAALGRFEQVTQ